MICGEHLFGSWRPEAVTALPAGTSGYKRRCLQHDGRLVFCLRTMPRTAPDTTSFAQPPEGCTLQLNPFRSNVPQAELDGLKSLLRLSRIGKKTRENTHTTARGMALPVQETEAKDTQRYGVEHSWMTEMRDKWLQYDW